MDRSGKSMTEKYTIEYVKSPNHFKTIQTSYDIVTKGHHWELSVESWKARPDDPVGRGQGSEFIILLPVDQRG